MPNGEIIEGSMDFSLMIALGRLGVPLFLMLTGPFASASVSTQLE